MENFIDTLSIREKEVLENLPNKSYINFENLKHRLEEHYNSDIVNLHSQEHFTLDDMVLIKALTPVTIVNKEDIPSWINKQDRRILRENISISYENRTTEYFILNISITLIVLFSDIGLRGAAHPESGLKSSTAGYAAANLNKALGCFSTTENGNNIYPMYAIVEHQASQRSYINSVSSYGRSYTKTGECLGVMVVIQFKPYILRRSTFIFGDSTYGLTKNELETYTGYRDDSEIRKFFNMTSLTYNDIEKIETYMNNKYGKNIIMFKYLRSNNETKFQTVASPEHLVNSLITSNELPGAFAIYNNLRTNGNMTYNVDYIEAQILGPIKSSDCEHIYINNICREPFEKLISNLDATFDNVRKRYYDGINTGMIIFHDL